MSKPFIPGDARELELYNSMVGAEFAYYQYIREKLIPKFLEETKDNVMDETHWGHKMLFGNPIIPEGQCEEELKNLYYKLSKICHPDKNNAKWANSMFKIINEAYHQKDSDKLKQIEQHWNEHETFDDYGELKLEVANKKSKAEIIEEWKSQIWFQWWLPGSLIREIFIPQDVYEKRMQEEKDKLKEEKRKLEEENERLRKTLEGRLQSLESGDKVPPLKIDDFIPN